VNASTVSVNESIQFTDESSDSDGSISSWSWDFGDGLSSTATDPVYSFSEAGNYTVELVVEDDKGATDSTTESVTVEEESSNDDDGGMVLLVEAISAIQTTVMGIIRMYRMMAIMKENSRGQTGC